MVVSPLQRSADEAEMKEFMSHLLPPGEEYHDMPRYMRPINNTYEDYGKAGKWEGGTNSADNSSGLFDTAYHSQETHTAQDVIEQLLNARISPANLPDMHASFPAAERYLQVISQQLKDRVRQIHVSGSNPREKESKFGGRVLLREEPQRSQKGRAGAPVTERSECSVLWKHCVTLSNKWRRETSLFSEALTLALEALEREVEAGEALREELRAKQLALELLLSRVNTGPRPSEAEAEAAGDGS